MKLIGINRIRIDMQKHQIATDDRIITPAPKEWSLLTMLVEANGDIVSREMLLEKIWGHGGLQTRTVDQHAARLRHHLRLPDHHAVIVTVTNEGYRANMPNIEVAEQAIAPSLSGMSPERFAKFMLGIGPIYWTTVNKHLTELKVPAKTIGKLETRLMRQYLKKVPA